MTHVERPLDGPVMTRRDFLVLAAGAALTACGGSVKPERGPITPPLTGAPTEFATTTLPEPASTTITPEPTTTPSIATKTTESPIIPQKVEGNITIGAIRELLQPSEENKAAYDKWANQNKWYGPKTTSSGERPATGNHNPKFEFETYHKVKENITDPNDTRKYGIHDSIVITSEAGGEYVLTTVSGINIGDLQIPIHDKAGSTVRVVLQLVIFPDGERAIIPIFMGSNHADIPRVVNGVATEVIVGTRPGSTYKTKDPRMNGKNHAPFSVSLGATLPPEEDYKTLNGVTGTRMWTLLQSSTVTNHYPGSTSLIYDVKKLDTVAKALANPIDAAVPPITLVTFPRGIEGVINAFRIGDSAELTAALEASQLITTNKIPEFMTEGFGSVGEMFSNVVIPTSTVFTDKINPDSTRNQEPFPLPIEQ